MNGQKVTQDIHSIWEQAIAQAEASVLPRYLDLFHSVPPPIEVNGAQQWVTELTAKKMWGVLSHVSKMKDLFYYPQTRQEKVSFVVL
jgi:hypothetical protein